MTVYNDTHVCKVVHFPVRFRFLCVYLGFVFLCVLSFYVSFGHFVLILLAFVILGLVSSVGLLSQEIGWEERL